MSIFAQKTTQTLNDFERKQIIDLLKTHFPYKSTSDINLLTIENQNLDIVLIKKERDVMGVSYYQTHKTKTPFSSRKLTSIYFGIAVKNRLYSGNIIWKMGNWYANKNISYLYPLKKVTGVSLISSPRVMENFIKLFPHNTFNFSDSQKSQVITFANNYLQTSIGIPVELKSSFILDRENENTDITDNWNRYHKSRNPKINDFFISNNIIEFNKDRILRTSKVLVAVGYRNALDNFKRNNNSAIL